MKSGQINKRGDNVRTKKKGRDSVLKLFNPEEMSMKDILTDIDQHSWKYTTPTTKENTVHVKLDNFCD